MPLIPGTRLGPYEILAPLGAGGMGEVYRARDPRLGRDVAIKALPDGFARDPERLARFEREARLLASLTHAHIAGIHGLEEHEGQRYLVLEFVDGETLADRLRRGPLPIDESIETARDIARALEAAHESGIVHRDLKPGNIMLTPAGAVKVLDFGLAKAGATTGSSSSADLSASPTMTHAATGAGMILGTAAYMSPEQARGKPVDRRTDIWSFGCVLYECLTGRPTFEGETVSDLVAKILQGDPDWTALPERTPAVVRRLLERCLRKDARERLRDIGDARIELEELLARGLSGSDVVGATNGTVARSPRAFRSAALAWGVAAVAGLIGLALAAVLLFLPGRERESNSPILRVTLTSPAGTQMSTAPGDMGISPDGTMIVFSASDSTGTSSRLWLRTVTSLETRVLEGTEHTGGADPGCPFWSPDSRSIGFFADGQLKTASIMGGSPQVVASVGNARGGTWSAEGVILYAPSSQGPLYRVSERGGEAVQVTTLDSTETAHRFPRFLPDGRHYQFISFPGQEGLIDTWVGTLDADDRSRVASAESGALLAVPGYMVFLRDQSLVAQPFDLRKMKPTGEGIQIGLAPDNFNTLGTYPASLSDNRMMVYPTSAPSPTRLTWFGRDGNRLGDLSIPEAEYSEMSFSPDDRQIALLRRNSPTSLDVWIVDAGRGTMSQLTTDGGQKFSVIWSGDGRRVAYAYQRGGEYNFVERPVSGTGAEERLPAPATPFKNLNQLSPNGAFLVYDDLGATTQRDIWVVPLRDGGRPEPYLTTPFNEAFGSISPDGRWMLYVSDESGRFEIYVQSFPNPGTKLRISNDGGTVGFWRRDGAEILFRSQRGIMSVTVSGSEEIATGTPRLLMTPPKRTVFVAVTSDFERILVSLPSEDAPRRSLTLLTNWPALLERRTAGR